MAQTSTPGRVRYWRRPQWVPTRSVPAGLRALRAVLTVPVLFAITLKGFGNLQLAMFTGFGGLAFLVMASFGGTRRDKVIAYLGLAVVGSAAISIGTAVSGSTVLATVVTVPVACGIFFAGVAGPNAAGGVTAALLAYVLPVGIPGTVSMIPDRLAGWWLAGTVSTLLVLVLSPPSPGDKLRAACADSAAALSALLDGVVRGDATPPLRKSADEAGLRVVEAFESSPYRPVGLATADQALYSVVQLLQWCTALVRDMTEELPGPAGDNALVAASGATLAEVAALLRGAASPGLLGDLDPFSDPQATRPDASPPSESPDAVLAAARRAFHEQAIAVTARALILDAMVATRHADPETVAARRREWYGAEPREVAGGRRRTALAGEISLLARHASLRSVWALNSLRGSIGLTAAVLVADLSGVQHAFWVVLGTLSVLRTSAATTEANALRALSGTILGFAVGAALLIGIGTSQTALWVTLPIAVAVAAYAPGVLPFTFGQAAFTVLVLVLFNLLVPVGWTVGVIRVEDVAMGCAVSLVVGLLFWPRGAGAVVGDDLADAYRHGSEYLTEAVDWALSRRDNPPTAGPATVTAAIRLDEALRGYLAEQGSKRVPKSDLWDLVGAVTRLRLTAYSIASLRSVAAPEPGQAALTRATADLSGFYQRVAALVGPPVAGQVLEPVRLPPLSGLDGSWPHHDLQWIQEHLHHLGTHSHVVSDPAVRVAEQRSLPWWR